MNATIENVNYFPVLSPNGINDAVPEIEIYNHIEISIKLMANSIPANINLFDEDDVLIKATFEHIDSNSQFLINGFYFEEWHEKIVPTEVDLLSYNQATREIQVISELEKSASTNPQFKVRFTPTLLGKWTFGLTINGSPIDLGTINNIFYVINAANPGFIEKANKRYFKTKVGGAKFDAKAFYPIGINVAHFDFNTWRGRKEYGFNQYKEYLDKIASVNGNTIRIFIDGGINLLGYDFVLQKQFFRNFNAKNASILDTIIEYAQKKGIYIQFCIFNYTSLGNQLHADNYWQDYNPFNLNCSNKEIINNHFEYGFISNPYDFFTNADCLELQKKLLKYITNRWGYSTNIFCWEIFNESVQIEAVNKIDENTPEFDTTQISNFTEKYITWFNEIYLFIKQNDINKHLITTSHPTHTIGGGEGFLRINNLIDFTQSHLYKDFTLKNISDHNNLMKAFSWEAKEYLTYFDKPFGIGETQYLMDGYGSRFGYTQGFFDPLGYGIHDLLWASFFSGSYSPALFWSWHTFNFFNFFNHLSPISRILFKISENIGILNDNLIYEQYYHSSLTSEVNPISNNMNIMKISDTHKQIFLLWCQEINHYFHNLTKSLKNPSLNKYLNTLDETFKPQIVAPIIVKADNLIIGKKYQVTIYAPSSGKTISNRISSIPAFGSTLQIDVTEAIRSSLYGDVCILIKML